MVTVAVSVPPLFDAVIVYTVDGETTVGVPVSYTHLTLPTIYSV